VDQPGPQTLDSLTRDDLEGRRAFVRVDFNVPLEGEPPDIRIASDARIRASLPTIEELLKRGSTVVLSSHLGRPKGERVPALSLRPVGERLSDLLKLSVEFLSDPFGGAAKEWAGEDRRGGVFLLENLRYEPGETSNDEAFAGRLASFGDFFVQDAFGTTHRAHASTVGVARQLSPAVAGRLVEKELAAFRRLAAPDRPFVSILGGAKVAGKLEVVRQLVERCDHVCLGGGVANTFLLAKGIGIADSLVEPDLVGEAGALLESHGERIVLPIDGVVARRIEAGTETDTVGLEVAEGGVPEGWRILDVGPASVDRIEDVLAGARAIFWNGPLGVFETPPFDTATRRIADRLATLTGEGVYTVAGGGDSIAALEQAGKIEAVSHASTGGGAALELVSGRTLPGIEALDPEYRS
jgi:phosphoglycerate kinase